MDHLFSSEHPEGDPRKLLDGTQFAASIKGALGILLSFASISSGSKIASIAGITILLWLCKTFGEQQHARRMLTIQTVAKQSGEEHPFQDSKVKRCLLLSFRLKAMETATSPILLGLIAATEAAIYLTTGDVQHDFPELKIVFLLILVVCGTRDILWRRELHSIWASMGWL